MSKPYLLKRGSKWYSRIRVLRGLRPFWGAQIVQSLRSENFRLTCKKIIRKLEKFAVIWGEILIRTHNMRDNQKDTNSRLFLSACKNWNETRP